MKYIFMSQPLITGIERFPRGIGFSAVRLALRCSKPTKRRLLGVALLFLFCAAAALPLQAANLYCFSGAGGTAVWSAASGGDWATTSSGTSGANFVNGDYAYFYSSAVTPASGGVAVSMGSTVSTPGIYGNTYCTADLTFNNNTITLTGGSVLSGYALIRIQTAHKMTFNSALGGSTGAYFGYDTPSGGSFVLGNQNTYTGGTIVGAGTVVIQNGVNATGSGSVTVTNDPHGYSSAGVLTWNTAGAAIGGSVTVQSSVSSLIAQLGPSSGVASLHISGTLTFGSYSKPIFALSGTYNGANDQVAVTSTLACGSVQVGISCGSTFDTSGNDYVLFTSGGVSGSFSSTPIWTASTPQYASQYTIITSGNQVHLHFTPRALTVTAAANTKTYDGTTSAAATPSYTASLAGGNGYYTYTYNTVSTGVITQKALTVSGITAASTVYDGTTMAKLGGTAAF